ncbi:transglycosylase domain-containing protein [Thermoflavimicrobium daqui]|uniref:transglycosylase domain-containing protein n=1 Tax=Thermoflavimicrobium daqui TaxID=2137476 RepID=UPI00143CCB90|nr:transglycosylase domain-containing protein [Thermoflavimicrobium daqui]
MDERSMPPDYSTKAENKREDTEDNRDKDKYQIIIHKYSQVKAKKETLGSSQLPTESRNRGFPLVNWKWLSLVLITSFLLVFGILLTVILTSEFLPIERITEKDKPTIIYDRNNKEYAKLRKKLYEPISMESLRKKNPLLIDTIKKVEDQRFDHHSGVDYYSLARAIYKTLFSDKTEGGGTITMQVARNVILENLEQTLGRKLKEIVVAWNLERKYSKDQILEAYFNHIYYGNGIYGVQLAAKIYFGKDLSKDKLTPGEVAILVGIPKAPSGYSPYRLTKDQTGKTGIERLEERQKIVLSIMARKNDMKPLISEKERQFWSQAPISIRPKTDLLEYKRQVAATPFDTLIEAEIEKKFPQFKVDELNASGLKIYTNIDPKVQTAVETALQNDRLFTSYQNQLMPREKVEAGVTVIDPHDGSIVAIGGGRNFQPKLTRVRALDKHQPGSSIKPLTVYGPVIHLRKFHESTPLQDESLTVHGKRIQNFEHEYYGHVKMKDAVKYSLNSATVWLLEKHLGVDVAFDYGKKLGLPLIADDKNPSPLALGGLTRGVSTKDMAQAYSVFLGDGSYYEAHIIREIRGFATDEEEEITVKADYEPIQVFDRQTAWHMLQILRGTVMDSDGIRAARLAGREVAGKSGTTQNKEKGWFVGLTPNYVTAVVVFNEYQKDEKLNNKKYEIIGGGAPAKLFYSIMTDALKNTPPQTFVKPKGIENLETPIQQIGISGTFIDGKVKLSWTPSEKGVKYKLARSDDGYFYQEIAKNLTTTSYVDSIPKGGGILEKVLSFLTREKVYYYKVTALYPNGRNDEKTGTVSVTIPDQSTNEEKPSDNGNGIFDWLGF